MLYCCGQMFWNPLVWILNKVRELKYTVFRNFRTEINLMDGNTKIWNGLKIVIAIVPSFSLIMACLYYSVFFSNFDGLDLNILTVSDYFNKAVELIPVAVFVVFALLFALFMYPPRHETESVEEHYRRIGGSAKMSRMMDVVCLLYTSDAADE